MHTIGISFLWLNGLYFASLLFYGLSSESKKDHWNQLTRHFHSALSLWQLIGVEYIRIRSLNPIHLIWWYLLGWVIGRVVVACMMRQKGKS